MGENSIVILDNSDYVLKLQDYQNYNFKMKISLSPFYLYFFYPTAKTNIKDTYLNLVMVKRF